MYCICLRYVPCEVYRPSYLQKFLSTALARYEGAVPGVPTANAREIAATPAPIEAHLAVVGTRPNGRERHRIAVPCAIAVGTSQLHTQALFLALKFLFQPKL